MRLQFLAEEAQLWAVFCDTQYPLGYPIGKSRGMLNQENVLETQLHPFVLSSVLANGHPGRLARLGDSVEVPRLVVRNILHYYKVHLWQVKLMCLTFPGTIDQKQILQRRMVLLNPLMTIHTRH